jgi:hypothetical protein
MRGIVMNRERNLETLERRCDWLAARIAQSTGIRDLTYGRAELSALRWAIQQIHQQRSDLLTAKEGEA